MQKSIKNVCCIIAICCFTFISCSKSNITSENFTPQNYSINGKVEKGPFINGSTITMQPIDNKLETIGSIYNTTITDNMGSFTFGTKELQTPYVEMTASGYFFNEVTGEMSNGMIVLKSIADLSDKSSMNVNILTHLKYSRIKELVTSGKTFKEANNQSQSELLKEFGLQRYSSTDVSQFSVHSGTEESAALIAISSLLINNRNEGELTEYLSTISQEFSKNGKFSNSTKEQINKDKIKLYSILDDINENIIHRYSDLGMNVKVKDLKGYVDWDNDGLAGNEILKDQESVTFEKTEITVPKEGGEYLITFNSPIQLYTEIIFIDENQPSIVTSDIPIYEGVEDYSDLIEKSITNNTLTLKIKETIFRE